MGNRHRHPFGSNWANRKSCGRCCQLGSWHLPVGQWHRSENCQGQPFVYVSWQNWFAGVMVISLPLD